MSNFISNNIKSRIFCSVFIIINFYLYAQDENFTISPTVNTDQSIDFNYAKEMPGNYYVHIQFSNMSNCYTTEYKGVVSDYGGTILNLKPTNPQQGISYSFNYRFTRGTPNPKIEDTFQYILPFKTGKKEQFFEAGNLGEKYFGQEKNDSWKSYVVLLNKPDSIFCMRKGIVVKLTNEYDNEMSTTNEYTSKRNSMLIEHQDGTFAEYKGFQKDSFKVKLGQLVFPYTLLGVVALFDKTDNKYRFDFNLYYLNNVDNLDRDEHQSIKNYKHQYKYIAPKFFTSDGSITIETTKEYTATCNEAILLQEMSRSEKKKYFKDPTK